MEQITTFSRAPGLAAIGAITSAADDPAAAQLAAVLDRPVGTAQREALAIVDLLRGGLSTSAALGHRDPNAVPLDQEWEAPLADSMAGTPTDQARP